MRTTLFLIGLACFIGAYAEIRADDFAMAVAGACAGLGFILSSFSGPVRR